MPVPIAEAEEEEEGNRRTRRKMPLRPTPAPTPTADDRHCHRDRAAKDSLKTAESHIPEQRGGRGLSLSPLLLLLRQSARNHSKNVVVREDKKDGGELSRN